ncbi:MAG: hypothetical protein D5R98_00265 [Desulfonatronovibrio sp. MSAO_Bac4]|nr:MAG: hypothetical protein D5R98_00265 [Desulfonatronovibrio sp. MSAO_Bac4]
MFSAGNLTTQHKQGALRFSENINNELCAIAILGLKPDFNSMARLPARRLQPGGGLPLTLGLSTIDLSEKCKALVQGDESWMTGLL